MGSKVIDETGQKFGRWTVIKRVYPNKNGRAMWLCKCECGTVKIIGGIRLRDGHTQSCGCLKKELLIESKKINSGLASMRQAINSYKRSAKRRGLEYKLTEEQFAEITKRECFYCGAMPNSIQKATHQNGDYIYNGIDRIDNTKGYEIDNVVSCCASCNRAKWEMTLQEFKGWLKRIYNKMFGEKK